MFTGTRIANARHRVKFRQNRSNGCRDIAIFRFSKMAAAAILDFQKFKFLIARTFERPNLRCCAKFHQDRPIRCWDMAHFRFFKMAAVCHFGFLKLRFWILSGIRNAKCASPCQISSKSVKWLQRHCDFSVFHNGAAAILDFQKFKFLTARTFQRPNFRYCAKFHQDRPIRCWDIANFRFFKMADVGFLKLQFWIFSGIRIANGRHRAKFRENRSNGCGDNYYDFTVFQNGGRRHLGFSKIQNFTSWYAWRTQSA